METVRHEMLQFHWISSAFLWCKSSQSDMSWQEHLAGRGWFLMFLTTFPWSKWLKLSVDVAAHPQVPHAKGGALWLVLGHGTGQKHLVRTQEHDRGQMRSNRNSAAAAVTSDTGGQSALLLWHRWAFSGSHLTLGAAKECACSSWGQVNPAWASSWWSQGHCAHGPVLWWWPYPPSCQWHPGQPRWLMVALQVSASLGCEL